MAITDERKTRLQTVNPGTLPLAVILLAAERNEQGENKQWAQLVKAKVSTNKIVHKAGETKTREISTSRQMTGRWTLTIA